MFSYRIHSPVILIEFDREAPSPVGQNAEYATNGPTRNHIHAMLREPDGNNYGKSLLQQHLAAYDHQCTPYGVKHVARGNALANAATTLAAAAVAFILPPRLHHYWTEHCNVVYA